MKKAEENSSLASIQRELLNDISSHLHKTLDIDDLIPVLFADVNKAINAEGQSIWLIGDDDRIECRLATGPSSGSLAGVTIAADATSIVGTSIRDKKSIIIADAQDDSRHESSVDEATGFETRSLMTVPLVVEDKAIGAIQAVNKKDGGLFTDDDLTLFRSIADAAALAVNNARLMGKLQESYDLTLDALSNALDLRDKETEGHSRRVVEYTARMAQELGVPKGEITVMRRGALIHDIGKIGVPDAVLLKPGKLTPEEREVIEKHPQAGYDMLVDIPYLQNEIEIVLGHQERWDGEGYPRGQKGEEIDLGARIFMIADTFDALTSDRVYRKGCTYEKARSIIEEESGKQFDPKAVEAFCAVPGDEWTQIRQMVMDGIAERRKRKNERASRQKCADTCSEGM